MLLFETFFQFFAQSCLNFVTENGKSDEIARGIIFSKNITHNPFYLFFPTNRRPPLKKYTKIKKNKRRPPPPPKKEKKYTNIYLIN